MADRNRPARPKVIVTRRLPAAVEARMAELFDTQFNESDRPMDRAALADAMQRCDVLVPTVTDQIDAELIAGAAERMRMIANFGNGVDHIDIAAAHARRIVVTNTPGVLTEDTADLTMALILSVPRRVGEGRELLREGKWTGWSPTHMLGHRVGGKRLGIVGMGRIGMAVARRARAFGLSIAYHNRHQLPPQAEEEAGATFIPALDALMETSDIVTVHCPLTAQTRGMIGSRQFALMGADAYFINTARGEIADEDALIGALEQGVIAGAGLDVFAHEPAVDPRLLALPNAVLLPHLGSATMEARDAAGDKVITNIRIWVDGHSPRDRVLIERP